MNDDGNDFNAMALEGRKFFNPVSDVVCAFMALAKDTRGDVPFYLLPVLGGEDRLRGYELDRFTGRCLILFQQDIRFPVWGPFSGAVFAATGRVAPDVESLFSGTYHRAAGCGVRWYFDKEDNLVIRFDAAWGSDSNGVYIGFGEAF
jgi:outer membrane translocation and assembly module TamA